MQVISPVRHFNICHLLFKEVPAKNISCALIKIQRNYFREAQAMERVGKTEFIKTIPGERNADGPSEGTARAVRGNLLLPALPWQEKFCTVPCCGIKSMTFGVSLLLSASKYRTSLALSGALPKSLWFSVSRSPRDDLK